MFDFVDLQLNFMSHVFELPIKDNSIMGNETIED